MKRIILFRYHHNFDRNAEFLKFQKYLNPNINIYGLYGGPPENFELSNRIMHHVLNNNYLLKHSNPTWNWKNSDMSFQVWYNDFGHQLDFDMMHVYEWDLLYFEPLDNLFKNVPENGLALTGLIPLRKIEATWYWTRNPEKRKEWEQLMDFFRKEFNYNHEPMGMLGPGTSLPKSFLESIRHLKIPDLGNDELRIPLLAQACGFPMYDTGFYRKWFSKREFRYFNSNSLIVEQGTIEKQLRRRNGRRVFHPCNQELSLQELKNLHALIHLNPKPFHHKTLAFTYINKIINRCKSFLLKN